MKPNRKKPVPLMSLDLRYLQHTFTKNKTQNLKSKKDVSTQTTFDSIIPKIPISCSFESQACQTDSINENISSDRYTSSPNVSYAKVKPSVYQILKMIKHQNHFYQVVIWKRYYY